MEKIKLGIIGSGSIVKYRHAPEAKMNPHVDLVAICSDKIENAQKVAEMFGIEKIYTDYNEMLAKEELDAVVVATPNYLHADATIKAL